jgi:hypothetical protein
MNEQLFNQQRQVQQIDQSIVPAQAPVEQPKQSPVARIDLSSEENVYS